MSFAQNVALIAVTAALTGFLVPTVKSIMDQRYFRAQKRYEAELARQSSVIAAQAALLDELSTCFWDYLLRLISVSYYKTNSADARAEKAFEDYEETAADLLGRMQMQFSRARWLVSSTRYDELQTLYVVFANFDASLLRLHESNGDLSAWNSHHNSVFVYQKTVIDVLAKIAQEMRLAVAVQ